MKGVFKGKQEDGCNKDSGGKASMDGLQRAEPGHRGLAGYNWEESDFVVQ